MANACGACSSCCYDLKVQVQWMDQVPEDMYQEEDGFFYMLQRADGACVALQEGGCGIYEDRPTVCREFRQGNSECQEIISVRRLTSKLRVQK